MKETTTARKRRRSLEATKATSVLATFRISLPSFGCIFLLLLLLSSTMGSTRSVQSAFLLSSRHASAWQKSVTTNCKATKVLSASCQRMTRGFMTTARNDYFHVTTSASSSFRRPQQRQSACWLSSSTTSSSSSSSSESEAEEEIVTYAPPIVTDKKKIVFLGTPEVAATTLQTLYEASQQDDAEFAIVSVVTQPAKRRKRKGKTEPSPVGRVAEELEIPVWTPIKANHGAFLDALAAAQPNVCITAAYGQYLPKRFLVTPTLGTINIHPSLLPRWRGASPVQRSLEAGDETVGVTLLYTVSKMDAGPIIDQHVYQWKDEQEKQSATTSQMLPTLFGAGDDLLLNALPRLLDGTTTPETATAQDDTKAVPAAMIDPSEGELRAWCESATTCHNKVRAFDMWPGTYMYLQVGDEKKETEEQESPDKEGIESASSPTGENVPKKKKKGKQQARVSGEIMKVKIIATRVVSDILDAPLTDVVALGPTKKSGLYVTCHDGSVLELITVQPATRKAFGARDFQNGYPGETIRWVRTPEDAAGANAEKYNSRGGSSSGSTSTKSQSSATETKSETSFFFMDPVVRS